MIDARMSLLLSPPALLLVHAVKRLMSPAMACDFLAKRALWSRESLRLEMKGRPHDILATLTIFPRLGPLRLCCISRRTGSGKLEVQLTPEKLSLMAMLFTRSIAIAEKPASYCRPSHFQPTSQKPYPPPGGFTKTKAFSHLHAQKDDMT